MKRPLVSVLVPLYNHEKYIPDLLLSIIDQTYKNIEVLICDDCSSDHSYDIAKKSEARLRNRFEHVEILRNKKNGGVVKNVNKLIAMGKGDIIKIVDSDDFLYPTTIEDVVNEFEKNPDLELAITNVSIIGELDSYEKSKHTKPDNKGYKMPDVSTDWFYQLLYGNHVIWETVFIKRDYFRLLGEFDEDLYFEDWDWLLRAAKDNVNVKLIENTYVAYRMLSDSMSHDISYAKRRKMLRGDLQTIEKYRNCVNKKFFRGVLKQKCKVTLFLAAQQGIGLKETRELLEDVFSEFGEIPKCSNRIYYWTKFKKCIKYLIKHGGIKHESCT